MKKIWLQKYLLSDSDTNIDILNLLVEKKTKTKMIFDQ